MSELETPQERTQSFLYQIPATLFSGLLLLGACYMVLSFPNTQSPANTMMQVTQNAQPGLAAGFGADSSEMIVAVDTSMPIETIVHPVVQSLFRDTRSEGKEVEQGEMCGSKLQQEDLMNGCMYQHLPQHNTQFVVIDPSRTSLSAGQQQLQGVLAIAHGCGHSALDWCVPQVTCPKCVGLPEELAIVDAALKRMFVVVSVSSIKTCWSLEADSAGFVAAVQWTRNEIAKHSPETANLPTYLFGASSGGSFVSVIPTMPEASNLNIAGVAIQISSMQPVLALRFPTNVRVVFLPMARDVSLLDHAASISAVLRSRNVPALLVSLAPLAITPCFFTHRIWNFPALASVAVFNALKQHGYLTARTELSQQQDSESTVSKPLLYLRDDPRKSDWRGVVRGALEGIFESDSLAPDASSVSEVMNVAYGMHEASAEHIEDMFEFFAAQI